MAKISELPINVVTSNERKLLFARAKNGTKPVYSVASGVAWTSGLPADRQGLTRFCCQCGTRKSCTFASSFREDAG